jgi:hypothetical protein
MRGTKWGGEAFRRLPCPDGPGPRLGLRYNVIWLDDFEAFIMLQTCHEWIAKLAIGSELIAEMQLEADFDSDATLNPEALKLANCDAHSRMIARAIEELITNNSSSKKEARALLRNLIQRETYGAFAELAAYDWLSGCDVKFATQVPLSASDVLAKNGSTLDGKLRYGDIYFEVKAFGFNGRLAERLQARLAMEFPGEQVFVEGLNWTPFVGPRWLGFKV